VAAAEGSISTLDDVWVVVPVFNEAAVIGGVVKDLQREFRNVVCVDDGSGDRSSEEIRGTGAHLVRHPLNLGQGAALQTGLSYALGRPGAEYFVTFDADGQHRVDDAVAMAKRVRSGDCDVVLGSRFLGDATEETEVPWYKRIVLRLVAAVSPSSRRLRLTDAHNGLRVINRQVAERLHITHNGMAHASEIVSFLASGPWRVEEVPVTIEYTEYSRSKGQSLVNGVNILFDLVVRRGGRH
jgi:polyprenyl-phospho-N-acetylgalactosaminyl synthase